MEGILQPNAAQPENTLGTQKIGKLLVRFSVPCIVAMLVNSLYNIVDQIFIGWGVGALGNGATNVFFIIAMFSMSFAMLFGDGSAAYFSLRLGEGKKEDAARGVATALICISVVGIVFLTAGLIFLKPLLLLCGATPEILPLAAEYGRTAIFGLPLIMVSTALNAFIRADGSPGYAMLSMLSGAVLNCILDPIFLFALRLGVQGAAIATVAAQAVSFAVSLSYFARVKHVKFCRASFAFGIKRAGRVALLGISSFIDQIAFVAVMAVNNNLIVLHAAGSVYGSTSALTAFGIAMKVQQIVYSVILGLSLGMQPIVGYNYGAQKYDRVKRAAKLGIAAATAVSIVSTAILLGFPELIVAAFGLGGDAQIVAFFVRFSRTYFLLISFLGFQTAAGIFFQAMGKPLKAAAVSLSYQIVFRVLGAVVLSALFGLDGILWTGPAADVLTFAVALPLLILQLKQLSRQKNAA